jgi:hypothetical protein
LHLKALFDAACLTALVHYATTCRLPTNARAICAFGTGLYVRCSKLLWEIAFSTGLCVLVEGRLSGFYVRFFGTLGALSIYILYVQVKNL